MYKIKHDSKILYLFSESERYTCGYNSNRVVFPIISILNKLHHEMISLDFALITCLITCLTLTTAEIVQPCECRIDIEHRTADCSGLQMTNISDILNCVPMNTKELNLSNNNLNEIPSGFFIRFPYMENLILDNNRIVYLKSGSFKGLSQLDNLSVRFNLLSHNESYAVDVFSPLHNLHKLNMQGNCHPDMHCSYPDTALSALTSLQYLHIDGIADLDLGVGFSKLTSLYALYFSNNDNVYCHMPVLTATTFAALRQTPLSKLHLDGCDVVKLAPNVFRGLRNLTTLIVTGNRNLCSDSIDNATVGLNETNIKMLQFNEWCSGRRGYPKLGDLKGLKNTSLKRLDLGWNKINYVDPLIMENLPTSIEYFSLKRNFLNNAEFLAKLRLLNQVKTIDVSYQNYYTYASPPNASNALSSKRANKDDKLTTVHIYLPENVRTIYMSNIKLHYPIFSATFGPNKLQYLDGSSCMLLAFLGPVYGLNELQFLNLSHNRFTLFSPLSLIDMGNLTTLLLQHNEIGASLYSDKKGLTFSRQRKLEVLDLSNNIIKDLPYQLFVNQINLKNLSMADNSIKNVSFSLNTMTNLQHLNVSGNQIEYISNANTAALDRIAATHQIDLDLSGNTLACRCDSQHFMKWLALTEVNIVDKDNLYCLYKNNTILSISRLDEIQIQLKYDCTLAIVLTSCVTGFVVLLLVLSLVAVLYHKRWQLRYLYYIGRQNVNPYHPLEDEEILLEIDAYISYEMYYDVTDDVTMHQVVADTLYPYLTQRGFVIKIREELHSGKMLHDVISEAVRKSRKVIAILTPMYCKEFWTTFEFNMAAYEGIYTKRNIIIPVLAGDVPVSDIYMTPEIRSFIMTKVKSNEVLRFPSSENYDSQINAFTQQLEQFLRY